MKTKEGILSRAFPGWGVRRERHKFEIKRLQAASAVMEAMPEWVQDEDEKVWIKSLTGESAYSEQDLRNMHDEANKMYLTNPSARGLIDAMIRFIIGKQCKTVPADEAAKEYWALFVKKNNFDRRKKEILKRVFRDGEVFIRFFKAKGPMGVTTTDNVPLMRFIDANEITDTENVYTYGIQTDPDDVETPINYFRRFTKGNTEVNETIPASDIIHFKIMCDSNEKRGYSWLIGIAPFLKHYNRWLLDRIHLNHLRNLFNLIIKPSGVPAATFAAEMPNATTQGKSGDTINKKLPKSGTAVITRGTDYEFKNLNLNATDTAADGRHIERMVCKATLLVEGVVTGDYSNQNYASSLVAEAPMVKTIEEWQDEFGGLFELIFLWVLNYGKRNAGIAESVSEEVVTNFASMVHRDLNNDTIAYQMHKQNRWASDRTLAALLGYDYDAEQEQIDIEITKEKDRIRNEEGDEFT